jgi:hypothetical protein
VPEGVSILMDTGSSSCTSLIDWRDENTSAPAQQQAKKKPGAANSRNDNRAHKALTDRELLSPCQKNPQLARIIGKQKNSGQGAPCIPSWLYARHRRDATGHLNQGIDTVHKNTEK